MTKELNENKVTEDCAFGDGFVFKEIIPHMVDEDCNIKREILSVRLIEKGAVLDNDFIDEIIKTGKDENFKLVTETYKEMAVLGDFLLSLKKGFEANNK